MRVQRFLLLAGWLTISLLAVAGFATFSTGDSATTTSAAAGGGTIAGFASGGYIAGVGRAVEPTATTQATKEPSSSGASSLQLSSYLTERDVRQLVARYFEPSDVDRAVRVAWCESSFNAASIGVTDGGSGLFHLSPATWADVTSAAGRAGTDIFDAESNVAVAAWIVYNGDGWASFGCQG